MGGRGGVNLRTGHNGKRTNQRKKALKGFEGRGSGQHGKASYGYTRMNGCSRCRSHTGLSPGRGIRRKGLSFLESASILEMGEKASERRTGKKKRTTIGEGFKPQSKRICRFREGEGAEKGSLETAGLLKACILLSH